MAHRYILEDLIWFGYDKPLPEGAILDWSFVGLSYPTREEALEGQQFWEYIRGFPAKIVDTGRAG